MQNTNTIVKTVSLIIIISYIVYNVNYETSWPSNSFLHHAYGKDDFISRRLESVCTLSALFYFVLATKRKILFLLLGFVLGLLSFILSFYLFFRLTDNDLFPHIFAFALSIGLYYVIPRRWKLSKQLKTSAGMTKNTIATKRHER